jgi:glycerol-3-phosphate dehydrogenase
MYDVIIIGGGIIGCSIARALAKYQAKVGLLEKNVDVCTETSKANSAIMHAGYDAVPGTLKAKMNARGIKMLPQLSEELGFRFDPCGSLVLSFNEADDKILDELMERGRKNGNEDLRILDPEEIFEIEPRIARNVRHALYSPHAGVADPFNMCYGNIENAVQNGVELFLETEVLGLEKDDTSILIKTNRGEFRSRFVVNAAGLFSDRLAAMAGDRDFKILPTKGVYRILSRSPQEKIHTVIFQTPDERGKGILVTKTYAGNTMLGPTSELIGKMEDTPSLEESLAYVDELAQKSVPDVDLKRTIHTFTGVRAKPDTGDFMIYPSKHMPGVIHVGGIESPGLTSSPAIAEYVEELLVEAGFRAELDPNFNPIRQAFHKTAWMSDEGRKKLVAEDSLYGEKIDLCEDVSKAEILDALHRKPGAVTIDGIKRRVRAGGMGYCQGRRCVPTIRKIMAQELGISEEHIKTELHGDAIVERESQRLV